MLLKKLLLVVMLSVIFIPTGLVLAQNGEPIVSVDNLIGALTPLVIFGVTWLVKRIKPTLVGWNIVWVVVPILSLAASAVLVMAEQASSFWGQFGWNMLSVTIANLILQLSPEKREANKKQKLEAKSAL